MSSRGGACGRCGRGRRFWQRKCRSCRWSSRAERADSIADVGEAAVEFGALRWIGRGIRGVVRAIVD
ncbi:hypothetical protein M1P56_14835 [Streptomyces sp. HU2014]|uniref:hypothetical protein n=1 Tax=Streptomyces sp. HU2014 TaxID=2939414 RepID=UPI00200EA9C5|nr:hypothetical protein [Streptomyces sp. HU2014]UQI45534.1 hypothetical protein M1P56_14835 [Streptomyces sp. HU2014]